MVTSGARRPLARAARWDRLALGVALAAMIAASPAAAADPPAAPAAPASTKEQVLALYNQGKELLDAGNTREACQAFEAAKRLDFTAINLILRLGDCYERLGRTASAYSQYQQAAAAAAAAKDARRSTAEERVAAVAPLLARLSVTLAPGAAGAVVRRDGEIVASEKLGSAEPVDPGRYTFEATAPGKKAWTTTVEARPSALTAVEVPALAAIAMAIVIAAPRAPAPLPDRGASPRRAIGLALGGVGLVGVGVGVAFGVKALSNLAASKADGHCDAESFCDDEGFRLRNAARDAGTISTFTLALGATAAVAGVVLWLTAPARAKVPSRAPASSSRPPFSQVTAGASGDAHSGSVWLRGAF